MTKKIIVMLCGDWRLYYHTHDEWWLPLSLWTTDRNCASEHSDFDRIIVELKDDIILDTGLEPTIISEDKWKT